MTTDGRRDITWQRSPKTLAEVEAAAAAQGWPYYTVGDVLTVCKPRGRSYNFMLIDGTTYYRETAHVGGTYTHTRDAAPMHVSGPSFFCEAHGVVEPANRMVCLYINNNMHTVCHDGVNEVVAVARSKGYKVERG